LANHSHLTKNLTLPKLGIPYPEFGTGMCQYFQHYVLKMEQNKKSHLYCFALRDLGRMPSITLLLGAHKAIRTPDLFLTKEVLYLLSYMSLKSSSPCFLPNVLATCSGAGGGNRTRFISLEG
jgi:hypothetical protein